MSACRRHYPGRSDGTDSLIPAPSSSAFPRLQLGRLLHYQFRGLLSVHSRYNLQTRQVALCDPLHRRLRRLCYLHRRSDCFYEKVIKVKADVAALHCLISVLVAFGTSGPPSLRLLLFYFSCSLWLSPHFHRKCCVRIAQGPTRNSGRRRPPLPCFYPHSEWAA